MLHHSSSLLYNTKKNSQWWFFDCCMLIQDLTHSYYCCCKSHTYFTWLLNEKKIAVKISFKRHLARVIIWRLFLTLGFKENFNLWISLYFNASVAVMQVVVNPYRYPVHLTWAWAATFPSTISMGLGIGISSWGVCFDKAAISLQTV